MAEARRYRLEELRRLAADLGVGLGLPAARAATLATHLLWFDAAGASMFGIATLPGLLEALESGAIQGSAEGSIHNERTGTAELDGGNGIPILVLDRAGTLATEKARDAGIGFVRVTNVGPIASAAPVASAMALGPTAALLVGPGTAWTVALPGAGGLPTVFDPALGPTEGGRGTATATARAAKGAASVAPASRSLAELLTGDGGWIVAAYPVAGKESLEGFAARVAGRLEGFEARDGLLAPGPWELGLAAARERGVAVPATAWKALTLWAGRIGLTPPEPLPATPGRPR